MIGGTGFDCEGCGSELCYICMVYNKQCKECGHPVSQEQLDEFSYEIGEDDET